MAGLILTVVAGFTVLLGEQWLARRHRRRAIHQYIRWWVALAARELEGVASDYKSARDSWRTFAESIDEGAGERRQVTVTVSRAIVPAIGAALLSEAEHVPDPVLQGLAVTEAIVVQLAEDASHLMRASEELVTEFEAAKASVPMARKTARRLLIHYERTLALVDAAGQALSAVRADGLFDGMTDEATATASDSDESSAIPL